VFVSSLAGGFEKALFEREPEACIWNVDNEKHCACDLRFLIKKKV